MTIAAWPVVSRSRVVHAYKPGDSAATEGPFRTLRAHRWASPGVRVNRRAKGHLVGQVTMFSSLNVEAARLARHGNTEAAERFARAAARLEAGPEFNHLRGLLSDLPIGDAERVIDGILPADSPTDLMAALRAVARRVEGLRTDEPALAASVEVITGTIAEVHDGYVLLVRITGPATMIPRWMADAAQRNQVGALLALVLDRLADAAAVVEAVPAIELDDIDERSFTPFGRGDDRIYSLTDADTALLAGTPESLRILVPVRIEE